MIGYARCSSPGHDLQAGRQVPLELAERFEVSRQTVYRVLERAGRTAA